MISLHVTNEVGWSQPSPEGRAVLARPLCSLPLSWSFLCQCPATPSWRRPVCTVSAAAQGTLVGAGDLAAGGSHTGEGGSYSAARAGSAEA